MDKLIIVLVLIVISMIIRVLLYRKADNHKNADNVSCDRFDFINSTPGFKLSKSALDELRNAVYKKESEISKNQPGPRGGSTRYIYDVLKEYRVNLNELHRFVTTFLTGEIRPEDGEFVDTALFFFNLLEKNNDNLNVLHRLIVNPWHRCHEDIMGWLQSIGDESSIPFIIDSINLKPKIANLDYDDYGSYYKKCLWALTSIGTNGAKAVISHFTNSNIPELRDEAVYRLSKFDKCSDASRKQRLNRWMLENHE